MQELDPVNTTRPDRPVARDAPWSRMTPWVDLIAADECESGTDSSGFHMHRQEYGSDVQIALAFGHHVPGTWMRPFLPRRCTYTP